jgi:hypothetical protein
MCPQEKEIAVTYETARPAMTAQTAIMSETAVTPGTSKPARPAITAETAVTSKTAVTPGTSETASARPAMNFESRPSNCYRLTLTVDWAQYEGRESTDIWHWRARI